MNDPSTYWLTFTNAALGVVVLICFVAVGIGVVQEMAARRKKAREAASLDREVNDLVAAFGDGHGFHVPSLGVTMADGGEPVDRKDVQKDQER